MKNLALLLAFSPLFFAFAKAQDVKRTSTEANKTEGFVINGNVQGLGNEDVNLIDARTGQLVQKTTAREGVFTFKGSVPAPGPYVVVFGKIKDDPKTQQSLFFFLENAPVKVSGSKSDLKNLKVEGSLSQKDFAVFQQTFAPVFNNLNKVVTQINNAPEEKKQALMKQYTDALQRLQSEMEKFITARRSSYVSLYVVSATMQAAESVADVEKRYNLLSENLRNSSWGKEIAAYISTAKVGAVGTEAIDFTQNDVNDKPVALSSFRGKYVLVDFWASWCRPCRMENPNVVKVYNKFKDKNFTVLGVSLDQQKDSWVQAIAKDKLTWTHVSDLQFWNNAAAQLYHVQSIPQNFLIDPSGKIVAKDLRGEELEKKLCEYLGCSN